MVGYAWAWSAAESERANKGSGVSNVYRLDTRPEKTRQTRML